MRQFTNPHIILIAFWKIIQSSCFIYPQIHQNNCCKTSKWKGDIFLSSDQASDMEWDEGDAWETSINLTNKPYISSLVKDMNSHSFNDLFRVDDVSPSQDPLWEQIQKDALTALQPEPEAGPQIYQAILSQPTLLHALTQVIAIDVDTPSMPATAIRNLFLETLTAKDNWCIHMDVMAVSLRCASVGNAMMAVLFHKGLHTLVCHRLSHQLWLQGRTGLAYYIQSTMSRKYAVDIHPAAKIGAGIYLNAGTGVVVGETAVVGDDVTILQGVTLGGTGKERGNRHPKIGNAVILQEGCTVLGNIKVGDGAVITAKSIVTKEVPPLARVSGIPAKVKSFREDIVENDDDFNQDDSSHPLLYKYFKVWKTVAQPSTDDFT